MVDLNKPLVFDNYPATVVFIFESGSIVIALEDERTKTLKKNSQGYYWAYNAAGHPVRLKNGPKTTVKYGVFYPQTGMTYMQERPIKTSNYGLDQVVQFKLTYEGDKLVKKEII